jgi:hypothetical protein
MAHRDVPITNRLFAIVPKSLLLSKFIAGETLETGKSNVNQLNYGYRNCNIYKFTPGGVRSPIAFNPEATYLAIQPTPEPATFGLLAADAAALHLHLARNRWGFVE